MKNRKRTSEKKFINTMIITGVIGVSVMMITMIFAVRAFGTNQAGERKEATFSDNIIEAKPVAINKTIEGVIYERDRQGYKMEVWNIEDNQSVAIKLKDDTQLQDSYGKPMSIQEIQIGDILEVTYEIESKKAVSMQKSARSWTKSDITKIELNAENKNITIGNTVYNYSNDVIITDSHLNKIKISDIGKFDTLKIQGIDQVIWSIQVLKSPGYIKLVDLPIKEGTLEINNNQIYLLDEIEDKIPLPQGNHKIVIQMKGYLPFAEQVNIIEDEVYEINLKDVEKAMSNLDVYVVNTAEDYTVQIDNKRYKKGEIIQIQPGLYTLKLTAKGFEVFEKEIELEAGDQRIEVALEEKPVAEEKPKQENNNKGNEKDKEDKEEEVKTVQIIIETEPNEAQVFVSGVYKGTTPALTGLKPGEYNISIEKEGYTTLYTTIVIDGANKQKGFLYTLQKE